MEAYNTFQAEDPNKALLEGVPANAFSSGKHRRLNLVAIVLNIFVPWITFCVISWALSYWPHYKVPVLAWLLVVIGLAISAWSAYLAYQCVHNEQDPKWYAFFSVVMLLAVLLAIWVGDGNYRTYMEALFDLNNMNAYPNVDPSDQPGQQLMDAGRVYFSEGTSLDLRKGMSFKNHETYCVAPIVNGKDQQPSYDFWAVGIDCCEGQDPEFRCGEYNNVHSRAGLRLMRADERPFFRLAVQQAEAAYNIRAEHPMFFYWLQDPVLKMTLWAEAAWRFLAVSTLCHFVFNFFCVAGAVVVFSKMGTY
mmetsp:Transcript_34758/g.63240  ORF Transcript_34758/g.63240 Transcript_34758/m.63240 type:complete len:306 (-) Transcript_34758:76-993(-)|eukprot:CAMPEP_0197650986 /NCGR_PEP_ID=MMETSP1338-20131121/31282_1 /TAXON_ID=43686 ORGANISM="Pelagodinium beii, Strain RCC1491" /NCGR_SAMPLE_ID=MMETSP1338 /ASSEMBLY_ACC=CAM_ASM_000754 /LENGTH=305 /DNA_ID=CAMNT_0043225515 /DNA_START=84 /DNA_END=1001 /DNA_ORIENTATION=-